MISEPYSSSLLRNIQSWLDPLTDVYRADSAAESEIALQETHEIMGYKPPFDREQKCLNNLLTFKCANKLACLTVWAYYYDYKIANATRPFEHKRRTNSLEAVH